MTNAREERGLVIAATQKLVQKGKIWLVPSATGSGKKYTVHPDAETPFCSCPDFEEGHVCKHVFAVRYVTRREQGADGTVVETKTMTLTQKQTYKQNWPAYNLAQTTEKNRAQELLFDLCKGIQEPAPLASGGRPRTPMADMIFASVFKVYCGISSRRFGCDLNDAHAKGYVSRKLNPIMISAFLENPTMTPILHKLIAESAAPLAVVEKDFAVDSSGFSTSRHVRWFDEKYGAERSGRDWVKAHIACGVKTNVITAVRILGRDAGDSPQFGPLVKATAKGFEVREVSGDKAYASLENFEAVADVGGTGYIAFKSNTTGGVGGLFEKMFHFYAANKDEYMSHYHKRSLVESTFSMVKAKFRDHVRSKTDVAMTNEVLCKILCHNLCCLIMSQWELGIAATFWKEEPEGKVIEMPVANQVTAICKPVVVAEVRKENPMAFAMCGA